MLLTSQPAAWTVQMWVKRPSAAGYWFSLASHASDNCVLQGSGGGGLDASWRQIVAVMSGSVARFYKEGVDQGTVGFCGGTDFSFVLGNDQDGYQYVNDPNQACPLRVTAVAIYNTAWAAADVQAAAGKSVWEPTAVHAWKAETGTADQIGSLTLANAAPTIADSYYTGCAP